jgi:hypothetical protein
MFENPYPKLVLAGLLSGGVAALIAGAFIWLISKIQKFRDDAKNNGLW